MNYHFKAAFYERGLDVLKPDGIGRRKFFYVFQEIEVPFECSILQLSEGGLTIGRKQMTYAIEEWQRCMKSNVWPGYNNGVHIAMPPAWIERQWLERETNDTAMTGNTAPDGRVLPHLPVKIYGAN